MCLGLSQTTSTRLTCQRKRSLKWLAPRFPWSASGPRKKETATMILFVIETWPTQPPMERHSSTCWRALWAPAYLLCQWPSQTPVSGLVLSPPLLSEPSVRTVFIFWSSVPTSYAAALKYLHWHLLTLPRQHFLLAQRRCTNGHDLHGRCFLLPHFHVYNN